jgi:chromosome segregation ATPase
LAVAQKQLADLVVKVEEGKATQARVAEEAKQAQVAAIEKLTKDLTNQISDVKAKQDATSGQLQAMQVTNQGFIGRFDLIDQRLTQLVRQTDSLDGRTTSLEGRISKVESDFNVLRALYDRLGGRK